MNTKWQRFKNTSLVIMRRLLLWPIFVIGVVGLVVLLIFGGVYIADVKEHHHNLERAVAGDVEAMVDVANDYCDGDGVRHSGVKAVYWARRATRRGDSRGQTLLASLYQRGFGVSMNYPRAYNLYMLAAMQGDRDAQRALATCYLKGGIVKSNFVESIAWYTLCNIFRFPYRWSGYSSLPREISDCMDPYLDIPQYQKTSESGVCEDVCEAAYKRFIELKAIIGPYDVQSDLQLQVYTNLMIISGKLNHFMENNGRYPYALSEVYSDSEPVDPWGQPFIYVYPRDHNADSFDLSCIHPLGFSMNNWD